MLGSDTLAGNVDTSMKPSCQKADDPSVMQYKRTDHDDDTSGSFVSDIAILQNRRIAELLASCSAAQQFRNGDEQSK